MNKNIFKRGRDKAPTKSIKKTEKYAQEYMPFESISDNYITMENGRKLIFLRILSSGLNIASSQEVLTLIDDHKDFFNTMKHPFSVFCQDTGIKLDHIINSYKQKIENETNEINIAALEEDLSHIASQTSNETTQKSYYFRVELAKDLDFQRVHKQLEDAFANNGIEVVAVDREELKEILGVFFTGKHYDSYPDTELVYAPDFQAKVDKKKKMSYKEMQQKGIWSFKEFLSPISSRINTDNIKWGSRFTRTYVINNYILATNKSHLLEQAVNMKGVTTHIYYEMIEARTFADSWNAQIKVDNATSVEATDFIDNRVNANAVSETYERITSEGQSMMYVSVYHQLTAFSQEALDELSQKFETVVRRNNLEVESLQPNGLAEQGFRSVSPIGTNLLANLIKQNMPAESSANLYPFNQYGLVDPKGKFLGFETTPNDLVDRSVIALDVFRKHTQDRTNHNVLVSGDSGQGKTVLIMKILENLILNGDHVDFVDIEGTYVDFFKAMGGVAIDLSGNSEYAVNILQPRLLPEDPEANEKRYQTIDDHLPDVRRFFNLYKPEWTGAILDTVIIHLRETYRKKNITSATELKRLKPTDYPTLSDLFDEIESVFNNYESSSMPANDFGVPVTSTTQNYATKEMLSQILLGLTNCVKGRGDAKLFDRHTNVGINKLRSNAFVYDLSSILNSDPQRKVAQMFNILSFAQSNLNNLKVGQYYTMGIDEFHFLLKPEYKPVLNSLEGSLRTLRKWNGGLLMGTQTSAELLDSSDNELKVFFTIPSYKFFFYQGDIDYLKFKDFMRLTEAEVRLVSTSRLGKALLKFGKSKIDISVHMPKWYKEVKKDV
ncbi:VirB4 family type IV secretion system protein [Erysipelothrix rhusiopathiae]|nr:hypothetical protein [Erysipelothrix rhusiopathiae]MDV7678467.1 hypothetical protein [Erysipelothrix rhusiopathiae]WMT70167.1 hypothetical protein K0H77_01255 [Erysipelothrix rhusiopathiae]